VQSDGRDRAEKYGHAWVATPMPTVLITRMMRGMPTSITPMSVVIAGGGVGALEALMALHDLGEQQLRLTLVAPSDDFLLRPMAVAVPFSAGHITRVSLTSVCARFGATLHRAAIASVDANSRTVLCDDGTSLEYDRLILATGAASRPAYKSALTFDDASPTVINGLLQDIDEGYCDSIAIVVPPSGTWALPAYELALLIAREARESANDTIAVHLVTPEERPLAIFGREASEAVRGLLKGAGIILHAASYASIERPGEITLAPGGRRLDVARIVALPTLVGRVTAGVPRDDHGFVPVDDHGRVTGLDAVFAIGDGANFPVKQGGLATQQADVAAHVIAAAAGAAVESAPFRPVLRGVLLTGAKPRLLDDAGEAGLDEHRWWPMSKVVGHYLAPFLAGEESPTLMPTPTDDESMRLEVELSHDRRARPLALQPLGPLPQNGGR
jgi:sulfide:quinone oxidoreductase